MGSNIMIMREHLEKINAHRFTQKFDISQDAEKGTIIYNQLYYSYEYV